MHMHQASEFDEDENVAGQEPAWKRSKTVPATARRNSLEQKVSSSSASQRGRSWNRRRTTNSRRTNSNPRFHWQLSSVQEGTTTGFSPAASHAASRGPMSAVPPESASAKLPESQSESRPLASESDEFSSGWSWSYSAGQSSEWQQWQSSESSKWQSTEWQSSKWPSERQSPEWGSADSTQPRWPEGSTQATYDYESHVPQDEERRPRPDYGSYDESHQESWPRNRSYDKSHVPPQDEESWQRKDYGSYD